MIILIVLLVFIHLIVRDLEVLLFAPLAIRAITKAATEKKLKSRIIQIIKLINGDELDDDNTSANAAAKKEMIDNCLAERRILELLIPIS